MGKSELFIKRVYDIVNELKIPLIDEKVYEKVKFSTKSTIVTIIFSFLDEESIIRGFLGLADFFHTIVIKKKDKFYILINSALFRLECK